MMSDTPIYDRTLRDHFTMGRVKKYGRGVWVLAAKRIHEYVKFDHLGNEYPVSSREQATFQRMRRGQPATTKASDTKSFVPPRPKVTTKKRSSRSLEEAKLHTTEENSLVVINVNNTPNMPMDPLNQPIYCTKCRGTHLLRERCPDTTR